MRNILKLWTYLSERLKFRCYAYLALLVLSALAETISIGSVIPLVGITLSPDAHINSFGASVWQGLGVTGENVKAVVFSAFVLLALIAAIIKYLALKVGVSIGFDFGKELSERIYGGSLIARSDMRTALTSPELVSALSVKVTDVIYGTVLPTVNLVASALLVFAILIVICYLEPYVLMAAAIFAAVIYLPVTYFNKAKVQANSDKISKMAVNVVKTVQESCESIRDVIIYKLGWYYKNKFVSENDTLREAQASNQIIAGSPRILVEVVGILCITAYLFGSDGGDSANLVKGIAVIVFAAQKLMPSMQQIYYSLTHIQNNRSTLEDVLSLIAKSPDEERTDSRMASHEVVEITFDRVGYAFDGKTVLNNVTFKIASGEMVGIVGRSGSGKSTLVDLLIGFIPPTEGIVSINSEPLVQAKAASWRGLLAFVPQRVDLMSESVCKNITLEFSDKPINDPLLQKSLALSCLDDDIRGHKLSLGQVLTEGGKNISGGQKQRIGISRAIYSDRPVMIMDESTSGLDEIMSERIVSEIKKERKDRITIIVTHNTSLLKYCDRILRVADHTVTVQ